MSDPIVILSAARTPMGSMQGALSDASATEQNADVAPGEGAAQHGGLLGKNGIIALVGPAKDGYGMHRRLVYAPCYPGYGVVFKENLRSNTRQRTVKNRDKNSNALPLSSIRSNRSFIL